MLVEAFFLISPVVADNQGVGVKRQRRSLALLVLVALAASLSAFSLSIAFADDGFVTDEDDSPGPLDIERFGFFQEEDGGHLILDLYEDFGSVSSSTNR